MILKRKIKFILVTFSISILLWFALGYISALYLTAPNPQDSSLPELKGRSVMEVSLHTDDRISIAASFINLRSDKAVILLSGIKGNRLSNLTRMENYIAKGYSVLLPDLRGTGKSEGGKITFGWGERKDLIACYQFLKSKGIKKIGVHGCSLGAATIVYSLPETNDYEFMVLESCYDNLDNAFSNRVQKFYLPEFLYLPIRFFIEKTTAIKITELSPEKFIRYSSCPVLILAGDSENQLKVSETEQLFKSCASADKTLYIFKGGKHEDFKVRFENEYDKTLNNFINRLN